MDHRGDDTASATPLSSGTRRRRRRSSGEGDDVLLDAMLSELGIPTSDSKKKQKNKTDDAVIELITPPRPSRRAPSTAYAAANEEGKTEEDAYGGAQDDSILDLTTPTPPSTGKRGRRPSPRKARQSIVNLLSPEGSERSADLSDAPAEGYDEDLSRLRENEPTSRRRNLLTMLDSDDGHRYHRHGGHDDDSDEDEILRAITETQTRIHVPRTSASVTSAQRKITTQTSRPDDSRMRALLERATTRFDRGSDDETDAPKTTKRSQQKQKKKKQVPPKPAKEIVQAAVALEKRLFESPVGAAIKTALEGNSYNNKPVPFVLEPTFESDFNVIQWERRGDGHSSEEEDSEDASRYVIAMHYPAEAFLDLLADHGYDALVSAATWLGDESFRVGRKKKTVAWGSVVLIVEGMDRALIARSKKSKAKSTAASQTNASASTAELSITFSDLHELAFRLFMDTSVHTKFTCDLQATAAYVALLTREIIVAAVKQTSQEEFLESVPRSHSFRVLPGSGSTMNPFANTWLRMLQMIPSVSEDRAQSVLDHFPTFQSLLRAYDDPSRTTEEKEELLADKLNGTRLESALSRRIYRVFSGWNDNTAV